MRYEIEEALVKTLSEIDQLLGPDVVDQKKDEILELIDEYVAEEVDSARERAYDDGYEEGSYYVSDARSEGYDDGYSAGYQDGVTAEGFSSENDD